MKLSLLEYNMPLDIENLKITKRCSTSSKKNLNTSYIEILDEYGKNYQTHNITSGIAEAEEDINIVKSKGPVI